MLVLDETSDGTIVRVKARPGARRNALTGLHDGCLCVAVTQAPEQGKANSAIIALLAEQLGLNKSQLELLSGQTSSRKRLLIRSITAAELRSRIEVILPGNQQP